MSNDLGFRSSRPKKISISARIIGVGQPGREEGSIFLCLSLPSSSSSPSPCVLSSFSSYETNQLPPVTVDPSTAAAMSSDVPGYFVGRPMNQAEPAKEQQQGADEQRPATNAQIPGDYFVGRPANPQQPPSQPPRAQERSSFLAKCCPCLDSRAEG